MDKSTKIFTITIMFTYARASKCTCTPEKFLLVLCTISQAVASGIVSRKTALLEQRTMTSTYGLFRREIIDMNSISGVVTGNDITAYDVMHVRSCIECASHCLNVNCISYACQNQLCMSVSINIMKSHMQMA